MRENSGLIPVEVEKALMTLTVVLTAAAALTNESMGLSPFLGDRRALKGL